MSVTAIASNSYMPTFKGICLSKQINSGINLTKKVATHLSELNRTKLPINKNQKVLNGPFNFGFFAPPKTVKEKAEIIVNRWSTSAAITAGCLAQEPGIGIETVALTCITKTMIKKIFNIYERKGSLLGAITGVIAGHYAGINAVKKALVIAPGAGNAANATITYALHQLTGKAAISYCEKVPREFDEVATKADLISRFGLHMKAGVAAFSSEKVRFCLNKVLDVIF